MDERPKEMKHRAIDREKSERQLKGLDGDALAEDRERIAQRPHKEIFGADASEEETKKRPGEDDPRASPT